MKTTRSIGDARINPFLRYYAPHRRAWTPSLWPAAIVSAGTVFAFSWLARPTVIELAAFGIVLGFTTGWMQWAIWRHRHPIIPADEYITDLLRERRRNARWN
jgi:hypothetical protein